MRKLYGDSIRSDAGFVKVIKKVAQKNARLLESRAGKHAPEIKRVAREVKGTLDKVIVETAEVVEDFLAKCTCPDPSILRLSALWLPSLIPFSPPDVISPLHTFAILHATRASLTKRACLTTALLFAA